MATVTRVPRQSKLRLAEKPRVADGDRSRFSPQENTAAAAGPADGAKVKILREAKADVKSIDRHPANRRPTEASIAARAKSMADNGQLDKCVVRELEDGSRQMISGETRQLAAIRLGWSTIDCRFIECDDPTALILLAEYNGQRGDLNVLEKGQLILELCKPIAEKGAGLTREEAARRVGFESHGAASNAVRLLELSPFFQEKLTEGEISQAIARELLAIAKIPAALAEAEKQYKSAHKDKGRPWMRDHWQSASELRDNVVDDLVGENTRSMDRKVERNRYNEKQLGQHCYKGWPRLFDADPDLEQQLGIIEVTLCGETYDAATNVALFDKLQIPLVKAKLTKKKGSAAAKGRDDGDEEDDDDAGGKKKKAKPKPQPTAAELKARKKKQEEVLKKKTAAWRHEWLAEIVAREFEATIGEFIPGKIPFATIAAKMFLAWLAAQPWDNRTIRYVEPDERLINILDPNLKRVGIWDAIADAGENDQGLTWAKMLRWMAEILRLPQERDWTPRPVPIDVVEGLAGVIGVDLAKEWAELQQPSHADYERFKEFLDLHNGEQLGELAATSGHVLPPNGTRAAKLRLLTLESGGLVQYPLPKSIEPLPAKEITAKNAKGAKKGKK